MNFWKRYWDSLSEKGGSDYEVDRGIAFQGEDIECTSERKLLALIDPKAGDFIFDAGCGTGINLGRLSSGVKAMIGMDYSESMINRAENRIKKENITNVRLIVGNVSEIGIKSNMFDRIVCISVFQYLDDEECEEALREFVRVAKDGAIIVFHIKNLCSLYLSTLYVAKRLKKLFSKNVKIENYRFYKWYEKRLSELGAKIIDYQSGNIFLIDFFPKFLVHKIRRMEMKYCEGKLFRKYGADLHIKVEIKKP
ncbi:MAG: class I SAM-dependent methyltransferase [bacterium]